MGSQDLDGQGQKTETETCARIYLMENKRMNNVADITPDHEPVALAREMVERAPDAVAAFCVLVGKDGEIWRRACGHQKMEVVWACTRTIAELMSEE